MVIIRQAGRDWSVVNWPSRNAATPINPMDGSIPRIRLPKNKKKMGPGKRGERDSNCCWRQVRVPFESARGCWLLAAGCCSSQARVLHSCCAMHACASTSPMLSSSLLAVLLESVCALFFPFFIFLFGPRLVRFQQTATEKVTRVSSPVCWDSDATNSSRANEWRCGRRLTAGPLAVPNTRVRYLRKRCIQRFAAGPTSSVFLCTKLPSTSACSILVRPCSADPDGSANLQNLQTSKRIVRTAQHGRPVETSGSR